MIDYLVSVNLGAGKGNGRKSKAMARGKPKQRPGKGGGPIPGGGGAGPAQVWLRPLQLPRPRPAFVLLSTAADDGTVTTSRALARRPCSLARAALQHKPRLQDRVFHCVMCGWV